MDLSTDQRFTTEYGSHVFKLKETFEETDIKGNNNLFNSLKTDTNSNHGHDSSSLFQVKSASSNLEVDNSLFSYSSFKKAMDLRTHNRTSADAKRTIFEDAEFFAKNYRYKLLPITFQQVDETIIQSEHNYSLCSLNSESELEEDCSRTMDYSQIKEKNYKRRRTKFREGRDQEMVERKTLDDDSKSEIRLSCEQNKGFISEPQEQDAFPIPPIENFSVVQPLDLSASPLVQENKTEPHSLEHLDSIESENEEVAQLDSDKENMNGIRVTITRPDEKELYQPCDSFLNDIARLVPWLVEKDCFEVDILDRTCDRHNEPRRNRVYYVISEATWGLFQRTKERVILTNDRSLGQPVQKEEPDEKPSFLVFDQFSLAKCLAEYCQEIGGYFEYTCFEEKKKEEEDGEVENSEVTKEKKYVEEVTEEKKCVEELTEGKKCVEELTEEKKCVEEVTEEIENTQKVDEKVKETLEIITKEPETTTKSDLEEEKAIEEKETKPNSSRVEVAEKQNELLEQEPEVSKINKKSKETTRKQKRAPKESFKPTKKKTSKKPKPKEPETSKKYTSKQETSQKSGKPVSRKRRRKCKSLPEGQPPRKRSKPPEPEEFKRNTRSKKALEKSKTDKPTGKKKETIEKKKKVTGRGGRMNEEPKNLRSQKRNVPLTRTKTRSGKR